MVKLLKYLYSYKKIRLFKYFLTTRIGSNYHVVCDLPGVAKQDIQLHCTNQKLTIFAEIESTNEYDPLTNRIRERRHKQYRRRVRLPSQVDEAKIDAKLKGGVLKVILPKTQEHQGQNKQILAK